MESGDRMESLFENKTKYTKEIYDDFINFQANKYGFKEMIWYIIAILALFILSISCIGVLKWRVLIFWVIIGLIIYVFLRDGKTAKKQYKGVLRRTNDIAEYKFFDRYIETKYNGEQSKTYYIEIKKVFELEDRYYMFISKKYAFVLMKDGFTKGNNEEFRQFLDTKGLFRIINVK